MARFSLYVVFFFFNDTATTEIYTLSLHDALPIWLEHRHVDDVERGDPVLAQRLAQLVDCEDRKSTRLNSSHDQISYAVFCLKKKKKNYYTTIRRQRADARWCGVCVRNCHMQVRSY